jgi:protein subunit release factor B
MTDNNKIIFSLTRKDFEWDYYSGSGAGGQHRNKHRNCVRVHHPPSGARGNSQDHREKLANERAAFTRMANSPEMQKWLRVEAARKTGKLQEVEEEVDRMMQSHNIRIEVKDNGKWVEWKEND